MYVCLITQALSNKKKRDQVFKISMVHVFDVYNS